MYKSRLIGRYTGEERGPLLIALGGVHGNEPAGEKALDLVFKMLEVEPITNPNFKFKGRVLGLRGNLKALNQNKRFIERDLNRMWTPEIIQYVQNQSPYELENEFFELGAILHAVHKEIKDYQPEQVFFMDLHTTTAYGGIFTLVTDEEDSIDLAIQLRAPVVKEMLHGIHGTTLHYFNTGNLGVKTTAICFESGQHNEQVSVNRAIAAITNYLAAAGCIDRSHVENHHNILLIEHSLDLPKVTEVFYSFKIKEGIDFEMIPNYRNFQKVKKGRIIGLCE